ncbi:hypothetical protein DFH28DRAFT_1178671 [Melampsora americana]|nr:hypothetical protein DFH28DRAFT_1178671 [Melampsora americana]
MSPYGYSKLRCEEIVHTATLDGILKAVILSGLGNLAALYSLEKQNQHKSEENCRTYNLSTGKGTSVKEVINCLEIISGFEVKTIIKPPRLGDLDQVICDSSEAFKELNWKSEKTIFDMARDMWTFCLKNPNGLN